LALSFNIGCSIECPMQFLTTLKINFKLFIALNKRKRERKLKSTTEMPKISFKTSKRKKFQKKEEMVLMGSLDLVCCKIESRFVKKKEYTVLTYIPSIHTTGAPSPFLRIWSRNSEQLGARRCRMHADATFLAHSCDD